MIAAYDGDGVLSAFDNTFVATSLDIASVTNLVPLIVLIITSQFESF